ncbi:ABC-2 type transport system permease protein [Melghirimyces profundicolus]|uniref:ABC-2 type transport system permease protein n=1 Tax=Melghirimyces profundicolus TaxID=1242148 RepID=A0A2T6BXA5_9BACL|nr:ABC-2 family transporter protein [Melghirimyces profundicolus]PTX60712.1 ABC-2 type transport system permease protein [Melghirimyces profundicolus]
MLNTYLELIRIRFLMMLAYRVNYYSGMIIYSLNIGVYYFLWMAIYGENSTVNGTTAVQMATYVAVAWMSRAFYFNNLDREIAEEIRDGTVAVQLIRPYHYLLVKCFQGLGEGLFRLLLFSVPGLVIVSLVFPIHLPTDAGRWLGFVISLIFAFVINSQINVLTGLMAFFILNNTGLIRAKRVLVDLLSGLIIPIHFFPEWAGRVLSYLPFQGISYVPSTILSRGLPMEELFRYLGIQLLWGILLWIPIQLLWMTARRRLIVQGG